MLQGLTWVIGFQLLGTAISALVVPVLPGPILGLVLLFIFLLIKGHLGEHIQLASSTLLRFLPLMLIPPAIGIMAYTQEILEHFWAIVGTLVLSSVLSLVFTGWLMQFWVNRQEKKTCSTGMVQEKP